VCEPCFGASGTVEVCCHFTGQYSSAGRLRVACVSAARREMSIAARLEGRVKGTRTMEKKEGDWYEEEWSMDEAKGRVPAVLRKL
jgi:hypothetical protein